MDGIKKVSEVPPEVVQLEQKAKVRTEDLALKKQGQTTEPAVAVQEDKKAEKLDGEKREQLRASMSNLNKIMEHFDRKVKFAEYKDTDNWYVKIVNSKTNEVVKTIPSEKMLDLMERIDELVGLLVDETY